MEVVKTGPSLLPASVQGGRVWMGAEGSKYSDLSVSVVNDALGPPPIGKWIGVRYVAHWGQSGVRDGWLETWVAIDGGPWELHTTLGGVDWVLSDGPSGPGFNMIYFSWMFGGPDPLWAPNNPTRTGVRRFRDLAVVPGLVRP
jgi:hypothetical protein